MINVMLSRNDDRLLSSSLPQSREIIYSELTLPTRQNRATISYLKHRDATTCAPGVPNALELHLNDSHAGDSKTPKRPV